MLVRLFLLSVICALVGTALGVGVFLLLRLG